MTATMLGNGTRPIDFAEMDARRQRLVEPEREVIRGIWDDETKLWTNYRVEVRCIARLMGGTPKNPEVVEGWLRTKAMITDEDELMLAVAETLRRQGVEVKEDATMADLVTASKAMGAELKGNGFTSNRHGLVFESRKVKAMLKECTNILYAGDRWGKTRKGPKSCVAEWVFVEAADDNIALGVDVPDGTHLQIGQVTGPQGPRSTLTYFDFVWQPTIAFTVKSLEDRVRPEQWRAILSLGQEIGLGALRSQGHGRFKVTAFDRL